MAGRPAPAPRGLGQRDRRATLVRVPWLRGGTAADTASVRRPRPGPAPGATAGIGRPDLGAAAGREGGPAHAAGRIFRSATHAAVDGLDAPYGRPVARRTGRRQWRRRRER